jgi:hypothetical protein
MNCPQINKKKLNQALIKKKQEAIFFTLYLRKLRNFTARKLKWNIKILTLPF